MPRTTTKRSGPQVEQPKAHSGSRRRGGRGGLGGREDLRGLSFEQQEEALKPGRESKATKGLGIISSFRSLFTGDKGKKGGKHSRGKKGDEKQAPDSGVGAPTNVQRVHQPLAALAQQLGNDPEVAKLLRFDGNVLKLDRSALPKEDGAEEVDPQRPKVSIASPEEVLDVGALPPPRSIFDERGSGDGANGYVCRATTRDGRPVVVKRPFIVPGESDEEAPQVLFIAGDVDRTLAARMLAGKAAAPHMVDILASGKATTTFGEHQVQEHMVVMGALQETLDKRMERNGPLSPQEAEKHGSTMLKVIAAMQRAGLAHNDLKSDNLMFNGDDELVVIDFGEMSSQDGEFAQATGALATWAPNFQNESGAKKDSWASGLNLIAMLRGMKTSDVGGPFMECNSQEEVDDLLEAQLGEIPEDETGSAERLKGAIRGLLKYDEEARWDAETAYGHLGAR